MSRRAAMFKPSHITRAVAAAEKSGRRIAKVSLDPDGGLTLIYETGADASNEPLDLVAIMRGSDGPKKRCPRAN
jgi:hypothetical protein